jgi:hypothetical protein
MEVQMKDDVWADMAIAAMLERIRKVCIFEYGLLIAELRRG